nr:RecName: Full=Non-arginase growth inhibitory factor; Short=NAGIF [Rattus norvegicus]
AEPVEPWS